MVRAVSRRGRIKMTEEEVDAFLAEQRIVICATTGRDGWPHLMPLWYVVRDGELWAWTYAKSQKVRNLERDDRVTLQVEAGDAYDQLHGAMIKARRCCTVTPTTSRRSGSRSSPATPAAIPTPSARWSPSRHQSAWPCSSW